MSQEQNKKVDLEHFKTVITECDIMKHIETGSLKVSDQVIVWSIRAEYTNADRVLDSRSQIFARMWSKGLFHTLTVHVYVGIAILERERERELAMANKTGKACIPCNTFIFRKFLFIA